VGLAVVGASSESASPGGWGFGSAVRCDFPPVTDSGPSAALRARCRCEWSCLVSPSASWPAGCHAATTGGAREAGR